MGFLGDGRSEKPRFFGKRDEVEGNPNIKLQKDSDGYIVGISGPPPTTEYTAWHWNMDIEYIDNLMKTLYGNEKFIYESDDWGSGPAVAYAAKHGSRRLIALILTDPIAFDGYPVKEIEAIGRTSMLDDQTFMMGMGAADQTLWQIYKTMVHNPDKIYDQYILKDIIYPYAFVNYSESVSDFEDRRPPNSVSMGLRYHNLHVLADRASILGPSLLLPFNPENGRGVQYGMIDVPVMRAGRNLRHSPPYSSHLASEQVVQEEIYKGAASRGH